MARASGGANTLHPLTLGAGAQTETIQKIIFHIKISFSLFCYTVSN